MTLDWNDVLNVSSENCLPCSRDTSYNSLSCEFNLRAQISHITIKINWFVLLYLIAAKHSPFLCVFVNCSLFCYQVTDCKLTLAQILPHISFTLVKAWFNIYFDFNIIWSSIYQNALVVGALSCILGGRLDNVSLVIMCNSLMFNATGLLVMFKCCQLLASIFLFINLLPNNALRHSCIELLFRWISGIWSSWQIIFSVSQSICNIGYMEWYKALWAAIHWRF